MSVKITKFFNSKRNLSSFWRPRLIDPFAVQEGKFNFGQLKDSFYYNNWAESSFLADTSHKETLSLSFNFRRLIYFALVVTLLMAILFFKIVWLQLFNYENYRLLAEGNRLRSEIIEPKRGIIYTADLRPLVRNTANFVLYFRPIDLPRDELVRDRLLRQVSRALEGEKLSDENIFTAPLTAEVSIIGDNARFYELKEALSNVRIGSPESYQALFVADNIDYDRAILLSLQLQNWPGVFLSSKTRREYLQPEATSSLTLLTGSSLSHLLGYTGKISKEELKNLSNDYLPIDYVGKMGIEYSWEKELRGSPGRKNIEVDALGRQKKVVNEVAAVNGVNLRLSINWDLQKKAEEILLSYLEKNNLRRASLIALNPNNGEVLALISLPTYDNNLFAKGIKTEEYKVFLDDLDQPLFNRAVSGEFPSGSTIKPIFAAAALQEKIIDENTSFISSGGLQIGEWFFPDWKPGGHGTVNVRQALAWSVNTFFYYIGGGYGGFRGLGLDGLVKYAYLFGLGELSGIDLPGERPGFIPTSDWKRATKNEAWYIGDTYHVSIGQGDILVTPLQVVNYTAAIASGGILYRPHLVSAILGENSQVINQISPEIIRRDFIDAKNIKIVREGMRETVTTGSARSLNSLPVAVAGKTGTAQWSSKKANHAWFIGFAPYENPEIALVILVEEGVEGSTMAVPIAKDLLAWYYASR